MRLRLVASRRVEPALSDMSSSAAPSPPALVALRCVYAVADALALDALLPVYAVSLPVTLPDARDDDDVHEFAAADLLADLQRRATRRAWAMRVEVDVDQTAADAAGCDLYAQGPGDGLHLLAEALVPGGGRRLTLGTAFARAPEAAVLLAGAYVLQHGSAAPTAIDPALAAFFKLGLTEYEFEA